ncbi:unnamed protein product [Closterium sp. NIES-54]
MKSKAAARSRKLAQRTQPRVARVDENGDGSGDGDGIRRAPFVDEERHPSETRQSLRDATASSPAQAGILRSSHEERRRQEASAHMPFALEEEISTKVREEAMAGRKLLSLRTTNGAERMVAESAAEKRGDREAATTEYGDEGDDGDDVYEARGAPRSPPLRWRREDATDARSESADASPPRIDLNVDLNPSLDMTLGPKRNPNLGPSRNPSLNPSLNPRLNPNLNPSPDTSLDLAFPFGRKAEALSTHGGSTREPVPLPLKLIQVDSQAPREQLLPLTLAPGAERVRSPATAGQLDFHTRRHRGTGSRREVPAERILSPAAADQHDSSYTRRHGVSGSGRESPAEMILAPATADQLDFYTPRHGVSVWEAAVVKQEDAPPLKQNDAAQAASELSLSLAVNRAGMGRLGSGLELGRLGSSAELGRLSSGAELGRLGSGAELGRLGSGAELGMLGSSGGCSGSVGGRRSVEEEREISAVEIVDRNKQLGPQPEQRQGRKGQGKGKGQGQGEGKGKGQGQGQGQGEGKGKGQGKGQVQGEGKGKGQVQGQGRSRQREKSRNFKLRQWLPGFAAGATSTAGAGATAAAGARAAAAGNFCGTTAAANSGSDRACSTVRTWSGCTRLNQSRI